MAVHTILVVDDDPIMRKSLMGALKTGKGWTVSSATDGLDALKKLEQDEFDLVITDMKMPQMSGLELLQSLRRQYPETTVIVMTAFGTVETAVEAMKNGAFDYLTKPFSVDQVEVVVQKALEHRQVLDENRYLREAIDAEFNFGTLVGDGEAMQRLYQIIQRVAPTDATVLIQGESGTGKELVARAIHYNSTRKNGPFIKVNCAALSSGLLESELFGHEKGAFTHAYSRRQGRFELADGGTLLLDEISEMDPELQAKLLRVLQEGEFDRVGGAATIRTNVRVLATTNRNLPDEVAHKRFRQDLYYRLNVIPVTLSALRERGGDIPLLAKHFLQKYSRKNGRRDMRFSAAALTALGRYSWPGNVRELENAIERAVVLSTEPQLGVEQFSFLPTETAAAEPAVALNLQAGIITLEQMEKQAILKGLQRCGGNKTQAAKLLGVTVRTLRNKIRQFQAEDSETWGKYFLGTDVAESVVPDTQPVPV